jgi:long-chain acyl-CoA synthetase
MLSHANVCGRPRQPARGSSRPRDLAGKKVVSYLPMAHIAERTVSHYLQVAMGYEVSCLPRPEPHRRLPRPRGQAQHRVRGAAGVGEDLRRGHRRAGRRPGEGRVSSTRRSQAAIPIVLRRSWGTATDEDDRHLPVPRRRGVQARCAQLLGLDESTRHHRRRPDPGRAAQWFRAIGVPLSEVYGMSENDRRHDLGPRARSSPAPSGRPCPGTEVRSPRTARSSAGAPRVPGLPQRPREDRRGARPTTAGCTPATSARSTTTATSRSSTARRS